jgi:arylformamidase
MRTRNVVVWCCLILLAAMTLQAQAAAATLPPGARLFSNLAYGPAPEQRLDLYQPARPTGDVIVMVHGGGWRTGDKAMASVVDTKMAHWVSTGTIFVSINYRLLPDADPLVQANDVADALAWTQRHVRRWGGNPNAVVLVGHSAGAHLVALVSADPAAARARGVAWWRGSITLDSAALDLEQLMRLPHLPLYDAAFGSDPLYWQAASPFAQLTRAAPPMLLVCSAQRLESCPNAQHFSDRAQVLADRAPVLPEALAHRDINDNLGLPGAYTAAVDSFIASFPRR